MSKARAHGRAERREAGRIAVTLGDVTGVGPEVTLKALEVLADEPGPGFLILGDARHLERMNRRFGLPFEPWAKGGAVGRFAFEDPREEPLEKHLEAGCPAAASAAVDWLRAGVARCLAGETTALVTAPVSKQAIIRAGVPFVGQTEFLSELTGRSRTAMMLLAPDDWGRWLRVVLVTTHVPLRGVADAVTRERVLLACELGTQACRDLGLPRARLGVAGLNPHAGEGGELGREEIEVIGPAVAEARETGWDVVGPISGDTLFYQALRGDFDVVVAMYHDQGLAPLKMIGFAQGVNWTLGLPFVRTSPDHGTAYDLAGRNRADPSSMIAALRLAIQLTRG